MLHMVRMVNPPVLKPWHAAVIHTTTSPKGVGALLAPISSTYFAQQPRWGNHYLVSTALAVFNLCLHIGVFRFQSLDGSSTPIPTNLYYIYIYDTNTRC